MDLKAIQNFYDNIQLPIPSTKDVEAATVKVDSLIMTPGMKRNMSRGQYKKEDTPLWERLGYGDLHHWRCNGGDAHWTTVGRLLNHPLMRVALDACTITNFEDDKILVMLSQVFKVQLSQEALDLYRTYFGNFRDFNRSDWQKYLSRVIDDQYVYTRIFAALTKPRDEVLHLCGLPAEGAFSDFLKNVLATASYKFNYYSKQVSSVADADARKWAKIGFEAGEKFEKYGAADASDFAKLVQTQFEYVSCEIPTINAEIANQIRPELNKPTEK